MFTSKYFCKQASHNECEHDWDSNTARILKVLDHLTSDCHLNNICIANDDEKDRLIQVLLQELYVTRQSSESYWQKKIQPALHDAGAKMSRRYLSKHRFVTDLSSDHVLIEIKHAKDFRTAFGQVADYTESMKKDKNCPTIWFKYILLFGNFSNWSADLWQDRKDICDRAGICLRRLD